MLKGLMSPSAASRALILAVISASSTCLCAGSLVLHAERESARRAARATPAARPCSILLVASMVDLLEAAFVPQPPYPRPCCGALDERGVYNLPAGSSSRAEVVLR